MNEKEIRDRMIRRYARKEPCIDHTARMMGAEANFHDVQIYKDKDCTVPVVRYSTAREVCPDRRNRYITINCFRYRLIWV